MGNYLFYDVPWLPKKSILSVESASDEGEVGSRLSILLAISSLCNIKESFQIRHVLDSSVVHRWLKQEAATLSQLSGYSPFKQALLMWILKSAVLLEDEEPFFLALYQWAVAEIQGIPQGTNLSTSDTKAVLALLCLGRRYMESGSKQFIGAFLDECGCPNMEILNTEMARLAFELGKFKTALTYGAMSFQCAKLVNGEPLEIAIFGRALVKLVEL